ncbi:MAG: hypothetical protein A4S09_11735 [Proteobacteria bacterium SG_bin7]|nr:MAG: hypothetical protein A4S09_11735 [Proteobacteria bacterium SG_bin7]
MWAIRILTGAQAGKTFLLKPGNNIVGRSPECDIKIDSRGVSKRHAEIFAFEDRVVINDAGSANGVFVNGTRVKSHQIAPGDKVTFHDIVIAVVPSKVSARAIGGQRVANYASSASQNAGPDLQSIPGGGGRQRNRDDDFIKKAQGYFDNVVMPGVYKLVEITELKLVLLFMMIAFIFAITSLQVLPMVTRMRTSLVSESLRRATTIAKNLKAVNEQALTSGNDALLDVMLAEREEGVKEALIVSAIDSRIKAPVTKANAIPVRPFILEAIKKDGSFSKQIDGSLLGASVPIQAFSAETSSIRTLAYAIVIYDMGARAVDAKMTAEIFIVNLLIALLVGFFLYIFLFKLFEYPFVSLNHQLDKALKDGTANLHLAFQLESLQKLCSNINSALSRTSSGPVSSGNVFVDRNREAENLIDGIPAPAIAIDAVNESIISANSYYERLTGSNNASLRRQSLSAIIDSALRQNLEDLISQFKRDNNSVPRSSLDFNGITNELRLHGIMDKDGAAYYIITIGQLGGI